MSTPTLAPNIIDLVDLNTTKAWCSLSLDNHDDDATIQFLITGFSQYVLNKTGIDCFNQVRDYVEIYDGNGASRMFLRNRPVVAVSSIQIGASTLPESSGLTVAGWYIEQSKNSIAIRTQGLSYPRAYTGFMPYVFMQGQGNIQVSYSAGFTKVPIDLMEAAMKAVAINYVRKDWKDLASRALTAQGATGTTSYRPWALPPEIERIVDFYGRYARP